jgi:hypothetical protein
MLNISQAVSNPATQKLSLLEELEEQLAGGKRGYFIDTKPGKSTYRYGEILGIVVMIKFHTL